MGSVSCVSHRSRALSHFLCVDYLSSKKSVFFKNRFCTVKFRPSSPSSMATSLQVNASSTVASDEVQGASSGLAGENDLMIVGPGVLGRLVADQWRQEHPGCQIYGQTVTTDHHNELIEMGINPCVKGSEVTQRFPYVIFCAPPSRSSDYPGDVRAGLLQLVGMVKAHCCSHQALLCLTAMTMDHVMRTVQLCQLGGALGQISF